MSLCISHLVGCRRGLTLGIEGWEGAGRLQWGAGSLLCQHIKGGIHLFLEIHLKQIK